MGEGMKEKMKAKKDEMEAKRKEKDVIVVSTVKEELVTLCPALQLRRALSEEKDEEKDKELAAKVSEVVRDMLSKKEEDEFCEYAAKNLDKTMKGLVNAVKKEMHKGHRKGG